MVRILTAAGISAYRLAPPGDDLIVAGVTAEVKRRKDGFKELYKCLEAASVAFLRCDIAAMSIHTYIEISTSTTPRPRHCVAAKESKQIKGWLESAGVLFMRADRKGWIVAMPIEHYKELMSWNGKSPP